MPASAGAAVVSARTSVRSCTRRASTAIQSRILEASLEVNRLQRNVVIQKLQEKLYILKGRTVGSARPRVQAEHRRFRDAPSLQIAERLLQMGARVHAYDPIAMDACRAQRPDLRIKYCNSAIECVSESDALVVVTEWEEFRGFELPALAAAMITADSVDGRNIFNPEEAMARVSITPA